MHQIKITREAGLTISQGIQFFLAKKKYFCMIVHLHPSTQVKFVDHLKHKDEDIQKCARANFNDKDASK